MLCELTKEEFTNMFGISKNFIYEVECEVIYDIYDDAIYDARYNMCSYSLFMTLRKLEERLSIGY